VEQLLEREEALAIDRIRDSLANVGSDLVRVTGLRGAIRRHPLLSTGLGACLGFVGGPLLLGAVKKVLSATSQIPIAIPGAQPPYGVPGLLLASLRKVAGRR